MGKSTELSLQKTGVRTVTPKPEIKACIMIAVWELTHDQPSHFVTCEEIAAKVGELFRKPPKFEYVRRIIGKMKKDEKSYPFEDSKLPAVEDRLTNPKRTYRLGRVVHHYDTAKILIELSKKVNFQRVATDEVDEFIKNFSQMYALNEQRVREKIVELIDLKYIDDLMNNTDLELTERFRNEMEYIVHLANKLPSPTFTQNPAQKK